jgi:hypothetical protein
MKIVKTLSLKFSDEENEILDRALKLIGEFGHSDACEALGCGNCPFTFLCNYNSAEAIERKINNLLNE